MTPTDSLTQIPVRLDFDAHADGFARAMAHLDRAATKELDKVDFDPKLRELVRIRASQLNGCAYCIDMHTKDARALGETEQRIYSLPAWREAPFFNERERAALSFTESVTLLAGDHVPTEASEAVAAHFDPDEDAAVEGRLAEEEVGVAGQFGKLVGGPAVAGVRERRRAVGDPEPVRLDPVVRDADRGHVEARRRERRPLFVLVELEGVLEHLR